MCGFLEKRLRARQTDIETDIETDRQREMRQYLMVQIRPVGVGPKKHILCNKKVYIHNLLNIIFQTKQKWSHPDVPSSVK